MMASTSGEKMPVLPRGWSRHVSNSCPGNCCKDQGLLMICTVPICNC